MTPDLNDLLKYEQYMNLLIIIYKNGGKVEIR